MELKPLPSLDLRGSGGLLHGVRRRLGTGEVAIIGRSRSCDISLRDSTGFSRHPRQRRVVLSRRFLSVSRVHCQIRYLGGSRVEIQDLSANGTLLDDDPIARVIVLELSGVAKLELGHPRYGRLFLSLGQENDGDRRAG